MPQFSTYFGLFDYEHLTRSTSYEVMNQKKKKTASGVITLHPTFPVGLLKSKCTADLKETGENLSMSESSTVSVGARSEPDTRQNLLCRSSRRRLQAKMEAETQEARKILQPLRDTEKGLMKELEKFFSQRDVTELRRRELLHKRWTEHVWFPLQRRVEERVSGFGSVEAKRRQSLYNHYLHHCNVKGFVFLDTYDLKEYNPFLLNIKKKHSLKSSMADFKEQFNLQIHEREKDLRTARSCKAGTNPQAFSSFPVSASRKTLREKEAQGSKPTSPLNIPHHISVSTTPDGGCLQPDCWYSKCGSDNNQQVYDDLNLHINEIHA